MQETQEMQIQSLDQEDSLEEGIATRSGIPAQEILWTEEPAGYSPWGCKESDVTEWLSVMRVKTTSGDFADL